MRLPGLFLIALLSTKSSAQELFVFSDVPLLQDPIGKRLGCDGIAAWAPHAPLSPAIRQGQTLNLLVAVTNQRGTPFVLQTGQNPTESLRVQTSRIFPATDGTGDPVVVSNPVRARIGESQTCALFLLVVMAPPDTPIGRIKLEPAIWIPDSAGGNYWIRYPMEIRVVAASSPRLPCLIQEVGLLRPLLQSAWEVLGECLKPMELPQSVEKIRKARQLSGRNQ